MLRCVLPVVRQLSADRDFPTSSVSTLLLYGIILSFSVVRIRTRTVVGSTELGSPTRNTSVPAPLGIEPNTVLVTQPGTRPQPTGVCPRRSEHFATGHGIRTNDCRDDTELNNTWLMALVQWCKWFYIRISPRACWDFATSAPKVVEGRRRFSI